MVRACIQHRQRPDQSGAVLVVGLILLVVLTLITLASMRTTLLQERMAGSFRDRNLALQAAEAALREGEMELQKAALPAFSDDPASASAGANPGFIPEITNLDCVLSATKTVKFEPANALHWRTCYTWNLHSMEYPRDIAQTAGRPRFVIEELPPIPSSATGGSAKAGKPLPDVSIYRVTARAVGRTEAAVVILQSTYRR